MSCVHTCARVCLCLHERAGGAGGAAWGACCTCGRCSMGSVGLVFEPKAKGCGVCLVCALVRECACACVLRQVEPAALLVALAAPAAAVGCEGSAGSEARLDNTWLRSGLCTLGCVEVCAQTCAIL